MKKSEPQLLNYRFYTGDYRDLKKKIDSSIKQNKNCFICTPTTEIIGATFRFPDVSKILKSATLLLPDSISLVELARLLGRKVKKRTTGIDTIYYLGKNKNCNYKVYYLGATSDVVSLAVEKSKENFPSFNVVGFRDGYFDDSELQDVISEINESKADILFVGLGFPKQERFIYDNMEKLTTPVKITVGGSFDVISGRVKRAPVWMQNSGIEWLFRLLQQPSRVGRIAVIPYYLIKILILDLLTPNISLKK
jgi:N-acetylglucosaminyldiphosphoundecaprenol N-acetyl-beta-D-mannosaminyltransferase